MPGQSQSSDGDCVRRLLSAWSEEGCPDSDASVLAECARTSQTESRQRYASVAYDSAFDLRSCSSNRRSCDPPSRGGSELADAPARPRSQQGQSGRPAAELLQDSARRDNAGGGATQGVAGRECCPEARWTAGEELPAKQQTDCISLFAEAFGLSTHTQELLELDLSFNAEGLCADALLSDGEVQATSGPRAEDAASQLNSPSFPPVDWLPDHLAGWEVDSADLPGISADFGSTASADAISECESQPRHAKQLASHDRHRPSARSLDFDAGQRSKRSSSRSPRNLRAATLDSSSRLESQAALRSIQASLEGQQHLELLEKNGLFKRARDASSAGPTYQQDAPLPAAFDQGRFEASSWQPDCPLYPQSPFHSSCSQRTVATAPLGHSSEHSGFNGELSIARRPRPPRCMSPFQRGCQEVSGHSSCLEDIWAPQQGPRASTESVGMEERCTKFAFPQSSATSENAAPYMHPQLHPDQNTFASSPLATCLSCFLNEEISASVIFTLTLQYCKQEHGRPDTGRRPIAHGCSRTERSTGVFFDGNDARLVPPPHICMPFARPQDIQTRVSAPAHAGRVFGSIISGVLQAARTSDEHTIYRIEEMHQKTQEKKQFKGVRREPWGISWTAFLPATQFQAEQVLGCFQDPDTAARVRDVAVLRLSGGTTVDEELNFPRAQYDGEDLLEVQQAPVSEFLATLHRYGAFGERRSSRFQGVLKSSKTTFQARLPASDDES